MKAVSFKQVTIDDKFWGKRIYVNRVITLPIEYELCKKTGRIEAMKLSWQKGMPNKPHWDWDSDVAKWIEAAAYSLTLYPDAELEKNVDYVVDIIAKYQDSDGYFNSYFQTCELENRWKNLHIKHELYCAGHLIEAAVALYEGLGKQRLLDVMCHYADLIHATFGTETGQIRGYPGHEEIELALIKLYKVTEKSRYLELSEYFINERGIEPLYFEYEAQKIAENQYYDPIILQRDHKQTHKLVRKQDTAEGHAVRVCYLGAGIADIAIETGDKELMETCRDIWNNITTKRMYITGGIGSQHQGERFSFDYDLPNESAYAETCAAIALVFFSHRMLLLENDAKYADIIETALYNGILSGVSLDGKHFFYENPLEVTPENTAFHRWNHSTGHVGRQEWFSCSCCPPNIARLLASLGGYIYTCNNKKLVVNLYIAGKAKFNIGNKEIVIEQKNNYPWDGDILFELQPATDIEFSLVLRLPAWNHGYQLKVNGIGVTAKVSKGYLKIKRIWRSGDRVELCLNMPIVLVEANPNVRQNSGKVAITRGPLVYCLEEIDNGKQLSEISISPDTCWEIKSNEEPGEITIISCTGKRRTTDKWNNRLYRPLKGNYDDVAVRALPYAFWANRSIGEMRVWLNSH